MSHNVEMEVLAPVLADFFTARTEAPAPAGRRLRWPSVAVSRYAVACSSADAHQMRFVLRAGQPNAQS